MTARKDAAAHSSGRRRLGRGLTSLISGGVPVPTGSDAPPTPGAVAAPAATSADSGVRMIGTEQIHPNPRQPRSHFDEQSLDALAASIRTAGLMQPIVVRPDPAGGFQLIVGERRWRAARRIGLVQVPAVVREIDDQAAAEWALIENIQREDLNALERADAFRRLIDEFGLTHRQVAERVGLDRSTVTNHLRLHELDEYTRDAVRGGHISLAAAIQLLSIQNTEARRSLAQLAIRQGWSVRTLESRVKSLGRERRTASTGQRHHRSDLERKLAEHLGTKVEIRSGKRKGSGKLVIDFYDLDQFEGLMQRLGFSTAKL